jgi:GDP-4-dehydro-6-deoxy-D-mannose reductase
MSTLLIAADSFLGQAVAPTLAARGERVVATSRQHPTQACDVTDDASVARVVRAVQPTCVICCAGVPHGSDETMHQVHVVGTRNVLHAVARHAPQAHVILFGSAAEYGPVCPPALPVAETHAAHPRTPYGFSKLALTHAAQELAPVLGLRVTVLRLFNVLGPGLARCYLAASLCERLRTRLDDAPVGIHNGHWTRDFVDIADVVAAVLCVANLAMPPGVAEVYNVATGQETTVLAVAMELCRLAGAPPPCDEGVAPTRSEIPRSCGDARKLHAATGWFPRVTWQASLAIMWQQAAGRRHAGGREAE